MNEEIGLRTLRRLDDDELRDDVETRRALPLESVHSFGTGGRREFQTADLKLNRTEYPNFTKLKYWGFIERRGTIGE